MNEDSFEMTQKNWVFPLGYSSKIFWYSSVLDIFCQTGWVCMWCVSGVEN